MDSTLTTDLNYVAFLDQWKTKLEEAKSNLERSKQRMAKYANRKQSPEATFNVGDLVLLSSRSLTLPRNFAPKFNHCCYGPYKVAKQINQVTYQLELPDNVQFQNVFHVNLLKRFKHDTKYGRQVLILKMARTNSNQRSFY
ncbi:hypothetical protein KP509_35G041800 [Ceratopteris richardii]|uniref:Tf2-1-like SH3-like domain-containing protein n=1 Tax=Ceratopteris richardii TaxID=49495 RepID=A0A8T2QG81_CERRI|nr:hypothetical protein KP509_35G041800 [Ceratopteris richardii]